METTSDTKTELTANFRCLNLVLVRGVKDPIKQQTIGRKVATVTLSDANVWGTLGENQLPNIEGLEQQRAICIFGQNEVLVSI